MEPINYRDALRRRWPVAVAIALVGAIIGGLFPVHTPFPPPHAQYEASTLVGVTPGSSSGVNSIGAPISMAQIIFFAANRQVVANAAKAAKIKAKTTALEKDVIINTSHKKRKKSLTPAGTLRITVKQPSAKRSANLTNAFVKALTNYIDQKLAAQHQQALRSAEQKVSNYENQLTNIEDQIQSLKAQEAPPPTTTTTTTTTTPPKTTTTTAPAQKTATVLAPPPTTTTSTPPTTTTTTATILTPGAVLRGAGSGPALAAANSDPTLQDLQAQAAVLEQAYQKALSDVATLKSNKPPTSGISVLQPALPGQAKKIPAKVSLLDHHPVRALLGFLAGGIVGIGLIFLLDALDKRIRSVNRTQETTGYPVLAEIPAALSSNRGPLRTQGRSGRSTGPVFATFTEPDSAGAEAYRMLRTAVLLEPMIGAGAGAGLGTLPGPTGSDPAGGPMQTAMADGLAGEAVASEERARRVVLVVSAGVEPSRALVVTNLAAAFAEAGEEALVVTTGDLRQRDLVHDTMVIGSVGVEQTPESVAASTRPTEIVGVRSLALSRLIGGPGQLGTRAPGILGAARQIADVVIVDAPLLAVHDAEALVPAVDVVLMVVESGWTRVDQATRSGVFLRRISAPVIGVVLTEVRFGRKDLRRVAERPDRSDADAEDEERLVRSSRMDRHGRRRRGRGSDWAEA